MQNSNNLNREELRKKLKNKIADKQKSRHIGVNRKKTIELHDKLKNIMTIFSENNVSLNTDNQGTSTPLNSADTITPDIINKINEIITKEDYNALLSKIINNPEMHNLLKSIQDQISNNLIKE